MAACKRERAWEGTRGGGEGEREQVREREKEREGEIIIQCHIICIRYFLAISLAIKCLISIDAIKCVLSK